MDKSEYFEYMMCVLSKVAITCNEQIEILKIKKDDGFNDEFKEGYISGLIYCMNMISLDYDFSQGDSHLMLSGKKRSEK